MQESNKANDLHKIVDTMEINAREPVLNKIFFFDNLDRETEPYLELSIPQLTHDIWRKSYGIFEYELKKINDYFKTLCKNNDVKLKPTKEYSVNLRTLFDLKSLNDHKFIILKNLSQDDLNKLTHEFKLRLELNDLSSYVISRNLAYLTFIILLEYVEDIGDSNLYLLVIITFLLIYTQVDNLAYFTGYSDTLDYSIYEMAKVLSTKNRMKFENLVSDSLRFFDKEQAYKALETLVKLSFESIPNRNNSLEEDTNLVILGLMSRDDKSNEGKIYEIRRKITEKMHAIDTGRIQQEPIVQGIKKNNPIESIISSQPFPDRFKSQFKKSDLSKQQIRFMLRSNTCKLSLFQAEISNIDQIFHIHYFSQNNDFIDCSVSFVVKLLEYYRLLPLTQNGSMNIKLNTGNYMNSRSNLIIHTGPNSDNQRFSPKFGLTKPRATNRIVIDSKKNIFDKTKELEYSLFYDRSTIIKVFKPDKPRSEFTILSELDLLLLVEDLLQHKAITSYELQMFEDQAIMFILLDSDQENRIVIGKLKQETSEQLGLLVRAGNLSIVWLIE